MNAPQILTLAAALQQALAHHNTGNLPEAERIYRAILQSAPSQPDATRNLAILKTQSRNAACAHLLALFNGGRHAEAEQQGRLLATEHPDFGFIWKVLGAALKAQGKDALPALQKAAELLPDDAEAHSNLGFAQADLGQYEQALASCRRALALDPGCAAAHNNLGNVYRDLGQTEDAAKSYRQAVAFAPALAEAHGNLGKVLNRLGRLDEAAASLGRALAIKPDAVDLHCALAAILTERGQADKAAMHCRRALEINHKSAEAHCNLGMAQSALKQYEEAAASYRRSLALAADSFAAHCNLSVALQELGRHADAADSCRLALALKPDSAEAHFNLGNALKTLGQADAALASYRRALEINPVLIDALTNLGVLLREGGRLAEALDTQRRALAIDPGYAEARHNLGIALLQNGELEAGWDYFRARSSPASRRPPCVALPALEFARWEGQPLAGKSLLIVREQGLGDEIQFCRTVPLLKRLGARRITLACNQALSELLATLDGVDRLHPLTPGNSRPEMHDYWTLMLDTPHHLAIGLHNIPAGIPYLTANPNRMRQVAAELADLAELADFAAPNPARAAKSGKSGESGKSDKMRKIGLCWKGNPGYTADAQRSLSLSPLLPLFALADCRFFTLIPGSRAEFLAAANGGGVDLGHEIDAAGPPFQETAALIMQLDLVITCDTAIGHLAGALGKPVWLLLPFVADWRWMEHREDSPWYPHTVLFRQRQAGDWDGVVRRVRERLEGLAAAS